MSEIKPASDHVYHFDWPNLHFIANILHDVNPLSQYATLRGRYACKHDI